MVIDGLKLWPFENVSPNGILAIIFDLEILKIAFVVIARANRQSKQRAFEPNINLTFL
jgi:hypothetical protein